MKEMDIIDYLLAKKKGSGSQVTVESLTVTANGTYSEAGKAYSPVTVAVPLGTKSITANGTYDATDDSLKGYSSVSVDVPLPENAYLLKDIPNTPTAIATFSDGANLPMPKLEVGIEPQQDLHGYDSPWVGGAGKNKIPITCNTQTKQGVTYTVYKNEDGAVIKIHAQGTATADHSFSVVDGYSVSNPFMVKAGSYWFKGLSNGVSGQFDFNLRKQGESSDLVQITDKKSLELSEDTYFQSCYLYVYSGATVNTDIYPMIWLKSSPNDDFAPYSNICPISGWDEVDVTVADDDTDPTISNVYTIDLDGTRYGGTLDVVSGVLTLTHGFAELSEEWDWNRSNTYQGSYYVYKSSELGYKIYTPFVCSHAVCTNTTYDYNYGKCLCESSVSFWLLSANSTIQDWKDYIVAQRTNGTPITMCYELATPLTIQLTPTAIKSLLGTNNIWADTSDILDGEYWSKTL